MVAYSFQKQFVDPILIGLDRGNEVSVAAYPAGTVIRPKRQTIRAVGKRRHARAGETLQLYYGMRTKQCFSIGVARCVNVRPIRISFDLPGGFDEVAIEGDEPFGAAAEDIHRLDDFAAKDGFVSWDAMLKFWSEQHPGIDRFEGVLIEWEPIR